MGGLAICVGIAVALVLFSPPLYLRQFGAVLAGAAFIATVGLLDDRYNLGIRTRFIAAAGAGAVVVLSGISFQFTGIGILDGALSVFWIMSITNAVNFQDNMDGLAAGSSAISAAFFLLIAFFFAWAALEFVALVRPLAPRAPWRLLLLTGTVTAAALVVAIDPDFFPVGSVAPASLAHAVMVAAALLAIVPPVAVVASGTPIVEAV